MAFPILGGLDRPHDGTTCDQHLLIQGWVMSPQGVVGRVEAWFGGQSLGLLDLMQVRPDVQENLPQAGRFSGFSKLVELPKAARSKGGELKIVVTLMDESTHKLSSVNLLPEEQVDAAPTRVLVWARGLEEGGSQLRMAEVVHQLCGLGAEVVVASPYEGPLRAELEGYGARVELVPTIPFGSVEEYDHAVQQAAEWAEPQGFDLVVAPTITGFPAVEIAAMIGARSWLRIGEYEPLRTVAEWLRMPLSPEVELRGRAAVALADVVQTRDRATSLRYRESG
ncbi:MAG TPA: glycosyltransferase [Marmoricola sp.]|nr:glycosyltransferase [Marmoricola sp.]